MSHAAGKRKRTPLPAPAEVDEDLACTIAQDGHCAPELAESDLPPGFSAEQTLSELLAAFGAWHRSHLPGAAPTAFAAAADAAASEASAADASAADASAADAVDWRSFRDEAELLDRLDAAWRKKNLDPDSAKAVRAAFDGKRNAQFHPWAGPSVSVSRFAETRATL